MSRGVAFDRILNEVVSASGVSANTLTDGQTSCTYGELGVLLDEVEAFLREASLTSETCVSVECNNSLPSALLLLTLLRGAYSFALSPLTEDSSLKPVPHFCSYSLTLDTSAPRKAGGPVTQHFRVARNPHHNGTPSMRRKVFMRTSGSMGASKIVVHAQERLIQNAYNCLHKYGFSSSSRVVVPVPIAHMYGFGAEFLPAIMAGASLDLQEKTNLVRYLDRERLFGPTIAFATPQLCSMLSKGFKTVRTTYDIFVVSTQQIDKNLFREFDARVGGRLINQYGSTELGAAAACDPADDLEVRTSSIGRPMPGVQFRIEPFEAETPDSGGMGELHCRHPYAFEGYVNENGEWIQQTSIGSWYRTGDAVVMQDGALSVLGRVDASINRNGYLVFFSEIETMLMTAGVLREAVVIADKSLGVHAQRIVAFCVLRSGTESDGASLRHLWCRALPKYAVPDEVLIVESIPRTPTGKVDRHALSMLLN